MIPEDELKMIKPSTVTDLAGVIRPVLDMQIKHELEDDLSEDKLSYAWEVVSMTKRNLELQLDFEHTSNISMRETPERLEIQINGGQLFFSKRGLTVKLPKTRDETLRRLEDDTE